MNVFKDLKPPRVIYETDSKYNGHIKIVDIASTRKLVVDNIVQSLNFSSPSVPKLYWGKVIQILKENAPDLNNVLILGLGGGTLVHLIAQQFPGTRITSVDIDQTMADIANNYFDLASVPNHRVIVDDALRLVVEPQKYGINENEFSVVIVDIYVGEAYPDLGKSGNFIGALKTLIAPGGLIIFNRIYREEHQEDVNMFIDYVSDFFSGVKNLVVAGYTNSDNVLIYSKV